ncbi:hypothetical protein N8I77_006140 [Diaporthe amygdali]|uniref:Uncharacterized protein n=1 Tax=Phomopsis amygdali TaxID=1214568 RepID=A0AAD9SG28_PHOAM|nr:hypothetical protein N8I77_006140 [Diaporthe amygdali]
MPPPIEEDEEVDLDGGAPSEQSASDDTILNNADADNTIPSLHDVQSRTSPEPVVSDIPFVTSDIQSPNETAAPEPVSKEFGKRETSVKRKSPDKRSNYGAEAKRRRGNPRSVPCVLCVRRLANDPKWACHDAVASQDGNPGYNDVVNVSDHTYPATSYHPRLSQEPERSGYNSSGSEMAQHSSSFDTSDDEDFPFRIASEPKVDVDMEDSESDGSSSETSASFRDGVEANDDEPEVKVEEK